MGGSSAVQCGTASRGLKDLVLASILYPRAQRALPSLAAFHLHPSHSSMVWRPMVETGLQTSSMLWRLDSGSWMLSCEGLC